MKLKRKKNQMNKIIKQTEKMKKIRAIVYISLAHWRQIITNNKKKHNHSSVFQFVHNEKW